MISESGKMYLASDKKDKTTEKTVGCTRTTMYIFYTDKLNPITENGKMVVIIQNKWQNIVPLILTVLIVQWQVLH